MGLLLFFSLFSFCFSFLLFLEKGLEGTTDFSLTIEKKKNKVPDLGLE